jgi:peptide/nickel transport system substrate-binding protein
MRRSMKFGAIIASSLLAAGLAACGSSGTTSGGKSGGPSGTLTISNSQGALWSCGFNPFNPSVLPQGVTMGQVYEPLVFVNTLQNAKASPWLATAWKWSNGNKVITFTIRKNVKFSDGTPMTAADVVFTFNMLKKFKGLDLNSVWSVLSSVTQQGSDQVVVTFKTQAVPYFYYIADQVAIVPQHIWSTIANPVTYNDSKPVGTGAFVVQQCTPQNITYVANKKYWQPGEPKIAKVLYPAFTSNDPANTYLATGQAQWGSQFIPNIKAFYTSKSPDNQYWFPPIANVTLIPNLTVPGLNNVAVRQAMAYAIDRNKVAQIGEYGYQPAANQTGIVTPTFSSWMDSASAAKYNYTYNPAKAQQVLTAAGFKKGSDGIFASPSGKKLAFTVINIGGYSDWVASMQVIQQNLKAVGIQVTADNLSQNAFFSRLYTGDYQLAYNNQTGGPSPYYEQRQWLYSPNSAPIGKQAATNWERYSNPATDKLIEQYGVTTDPAAQKQIVGQLQQVFLQDVPVIPVTEEVAWYQYNTAHFNGWVTQTNPYALPAAYAYPDMGQVLLHLQPK